MKCSVLSCSNNSSRAVPGLSFHRFPRDEDRKALWMKAIKRPNLVINLASSICSEHFKPEDLINLENRTRLSQTAVPALKIGDVPPPAPEPVVYENNNVIIITENNTVVIKETDKAAVKTQNIAAPIKTQNIAAPLKTQNIAAPVKTENIAAPVKTQNIAAPVKTENIAAPVKTENIAAPVKTENNSDENMI